MTFGQKLKRLRTDSNLTQSELAEKLNLSKANISKYESNDIEPNLQTLTSISKLFNVSLDYLLIGENLSYHALKDEQIERGYLMGKSEIVKAISDLKRFCKTQLQKLDVLNKTSIPTKSLEIVVDKLTSINDMAEDEIISKELNSINYSNLLYEYCIVNLYFKKLLEIIIDEETIDITKLKKEATYALKHVNKNIDTRLKEIQIIENLDIYNIDQEFLDKNKQIDISEDTTFLIAAHNDHPDEDQQEKMKRDAEKIKNLKK